MKCEGSYNANGESTSVTTVSSTGVVNNLTPRDTSWKSSATLNGKESLIKMVYCNCQEMGLPEGVDWTWILAIAGQESQFSQSACLTSSAGAKGLFQIIGETFTYLCKKVGCDTCNVCDNECNTKCCIQYFNDNWKIIEKQPNSNKLSTTDKIWCAYICHNSGPGNVKRGIGFCGYNKKANYPDNVAAIINVISNTEGHDFPIKVNAYHNYVLDWLSKHPNIV